MTLARPRLPPWPPLRALLLTLCLVVGLVSGCPVPSEQNLQHWPPTLVPLGRQLTSTRAALLLPFNWLGGALSVHQRWSLFSSADKQRFRIWIDARRKRGRWQLLYRPNDPTHAYQAEVIQYRRLRGAWNVHKRGPDAGYAPFADWIARTVFLDPNLKRYDQVRVRVERLRPAGPAGKLAGSGQFEYEQLRERGTELLGAR